jgi:hypothetical protein
MGHEKMKEAEKRPGRFANVSLITKIRFFRDEYYGYVQEISADGMDFFCSNNFQTGQDCDLELNLSDFGIVYLKGRVAWVTESSFHSEPGFLHGIELLSRHDKYDQFVKNLLEIGASINQIAN